MPRVNHLCGNLQLSGKDAIRKVIKSLSWPREIGIHSFDGPCISGKAVAERGSKRRRVVACYGRVKSLGPFLAKIFADLINEQQFEVSSWSKSGCVYVKMAVDKCELGTHFVMGVLSSNDYQNPKSLHLFGDIKAPAVDTFENHMFILKQYHDEIDGFIRGGMILTISNHREFPVKSHSCVMILHKDYRIQRNSV